MVINSDFIRTLSIDEIFEIREKDYYIELEECKKQDEEESIKYEQEIAIFKEKYPFCYVDVDKMTDADKRALCDAYNAKLSEFDISDGSIGKETSDMTLKNVDKSMLELMQNIILVDEPQNTYSYVERLNKEHQTCFFKINKKDLADQVFISNFKKCCSEAINRGMQFRVVLSEPMINKSNDSLIDYTYTNEEMLAIIELNNDLVSLGMRDQMRIDEFKNNISAFDFDRCWTLDDVIKANNQIDKLVDKIKEKRLSPFETVVFVHKFITQVFEYKQGNMEECRVLPGIIKTRKIVCSGYASMVKAIIDRLNIPELSCDIVGCEIYEKNESLDFEGGHCHNLIHIKDKKYSIDGVYVEDACWDSKTKDLPQGRGFAHCLYPVDDLKHFRDFYYVQKDKEGRLASLIFDPDEMREVIDEASQILNEEVEWKDLKFSKYLKRKKEVEYGADIVRKYGKTSQPIQIDDYKHAHKVVLEAFNLCLLSEQDKIVDKEIKMSQIFASSEFDKNAKSCFISEEASKQKKGKTSLKGNDGRI